MKLIRRNAISRVAAVAVAVAALPAGLVASAAAGSAATAPVSGPIVPAPTQCRLISFDKASVVPRITWTGLAPTVSYQLRVSGTKPYLNMTVKLVPLVYIQQPDFWGIQVMGCLPNGIGLPAVAPYTATLDLTGSLGKVGVEVIGTNKTQKIKVPGGGPYLPTY